METLLPAGHLGNGGDIEGGEKEDITGYPDKIKGQMILSIILTIVIVVVVIKIFGPVLLDLLSWLCGLLTLPLAPIGGFLGFLISALFFVGLLWLVVTLFGL